MSTAVDPYKYFRVEARELLDGLGQGVLELERGVPVREVLGRLLRLAHTLKGASRVVKLTAIARHAHAIEDVLTPLREDAGPAPAARVREVLALLGAIATEVAAIDAPAAAVLTPEASPAPPRARVTEPLETVRVEVEEMDALLEGVTEATVQLNGLRDEGEAAERAHGIAASLVARLGEGGHGEGQAASARTRALAEELLGMLGRLRRNVATGAEQVARELGQVRDAANRLRLLPARSLFDPLERATRDAALVLGKGVVFRATGGEGRIDAHVLTSLRDALLHVVRNAVAHGIEPELERIRAGKPAAGEVTLEVSRQGNLVGFACKDDGRGLDVEALRAEAVRAGRVSRAEAARLDVDGLVPFLLRGGLSTASVVTEVSGRGIGLDVVREIVERLRGEVRIRSERGRGTSVELRVPVSVASVPALLVDAGGTTAAIPLASVRQTMRLAEADIARAADGDSVVVAGEVVRLAELATMLVRQAPRRTEGRRSVVVLEARSGVAALGVERLLGTGNVIVRPLPAHAEVDPVVAGVALDAEGNPQLVLDPGELVAAAVTQRGAGSGDLVKHRLPVLVIDDSLTTRMLEQSILESAGYEVELATSAEEGLLKARARRYGLFVVDVEMPGMDGYTFVSRARSDPALESIPSILVTSRGSDDDRRRGEEAGARGYIVKGEFDQARLLETIQRVFG